MRDRSNRCPCTILGDWSGVDSRIAFGQSVATDSGRLARACSRNHGVRESFFFFFFVKEDGDLNNGPAWRHIPASTA